MQAKQLQQAAVEYERNVKSYLQQMMRAGSANMAGQPAAWGPNGTSYADRRGMTFRSGESPTDAQVKQWINAHNGNPYQRELMGLKGGKKLTRRQVANALTRAGAAEQSTLASFLQDAQDRLNEANDANKQRYEDILKRLEDRYSRNMGRVENWGKTAEADTRENAFETMSAIQANLSGRGLGNFANVEAFRQRNKRDLDRNLTQISEMRDSRAAQYDQALSGDIASFMERRTDKAPDFGQIAALAQAYGVGGGGQGFAGQDMGDGTYRQQQYIPAQQAPQIMPQGGVSAQTAMMMAGMTGAMMSPMTSVAGAFGSLPMAMANPVGNYYANGGGQYVPPGRTSNNPDRMTVEEMQAAGMELTPVQKRVLQERADSDARIRDRRNQMDKDAQLAEAIAEEQAYRASQRQASKQAQLYEAQLGEYLGRAGDALRGSNMGGYASGALNYLTGLPSRAVGAFAGYSPSSWGVSPQATSTPDAVAQRYRDYSDAITGPTNMAAAARATVGSMGAGYERLAREFPAYVPPPTPTWMRSHQKGLGLLTNAAGNVWQNIRDTARQMPQWQGWDSLVPYWMK